MRTNCNNALRELNAISNGLSASNVAVFNEQSRRWFRVFGSLCANNCLDFRRPRHSNLNSNIINSLINLSSSDSIKRSYNAVRNILIYNSNINYNNLVINEVPSHIPQSENPSETDIVIKIKQLTNIINKYFVVRLGRNNSDARSGVDGTTIVAQKQRYMVSFGTTINDITFRKGMVFEGVEGTFGFGDIHEGEKYLAVNIDGKKYELPMGNLTKTDKPLTDLKQLKDVSQKTAGLKRITKVAGLGAGLYFAHKKGKGTWGYVGFGLLGLIGGAIVGGLASKMIFKIKPTTIPNASKTPTSTTTTKPTTTTASLSNRKQDIDAIVNYFKNPIQGDSMSIEFPPQTEKIVTDYLAKLTDKDINTIKRAVVISGTAEKEMEGKTDAQISEILKTKYNITKQDMDILQSFMLGTIFKGFDSDKKS